MAVEASEKSPRFFLGGMLKSAAVNRGDGCQLSSQLSQAKGARGASCAGGPALEDRGWADEVGEKKYAPDIDTSYIA